MADPIKNVVKNKLATYATHFCYYLWYTNPLKQKPHGKYALGVTLLSNKGTIEITKLQFAHHSSMKTYTRYECIFKNTKRRCTISNSKYPKYQSLIESNHHLNKQSKSFHSTSNNTNFSPYYDHDPRDDFMKKIVKKKWRRNDATR